MVDVPCCVMVPVYALCHPASEKKYPGFDYNILGRTTEKWHTISYWFYPF